MILDADPVKPYSEGSRIRLNDVYYSIGRDYVEDALVNLLRRHKILALDIETGSVDSVVGSYTLKTVTIGSDEEVVVIDPRDPFQKELLKKALKILKGIILHNSSYDFPRLYVNGIITPEDSFKVIDTIIYSRLATPKESDRHAGANAKHDLTSLCNKYLKRPHFKSTANTLRDVVGASTNSQMYDIIDLHIPAFIYGAVDDVVVTFQLFHKVRRAAYDRITNHPFGAYGVQGDEAVKLVDREQLINRIMLNRSLRGLRVDTEYLDEYLDKHEQEQLRREQMMEELGIRPGNGEDLTKYLDSIGALPEDHPRTPTGKLKADKSTLQLLDHPLVNEFREYKEVKHIINDYLEKCKDMAALDGKIHPMVNILGASASGRMSMGDPPLQQFSKDARGIIAADEGDTMTSIDWSQIEPTLLLYLSKDTNAILSYQTGESDIYEMVGRAAGTTRDRSKVVFLAHAYGRGAEKLASQLGCSVEEAEILKSKIDKAYPIAMRYARRTVKNQASGGTIYTLSGRILTIPSFKGELKSYTAINYLIQGSAYDLLAESIVRIHEAGLSEAIYMAVHDELVISSEATEDIKRIMCEAPQRLIEMAGRTPILRVDAQFMGKRWKKV